MLLVRLIRQKLGRTKTYVLGKDFPDVPTAMKKVWSGDVIVSPSCTVRTSLAGYRLPETRYVKP